MASFAEIMASKPSVYQNTTVATLTSSAQTLGAGYGLFQSLSNLTGSSAGSAQVAQSGQAGSLVGSGTQVLSAVNQTQTMVNAGAQQMVAAKTRLSAIVKAATAEGFRVMPTGQVILGPAQIAEISAHPGRAAYFQAKMAMYNSQVSTVVFQTTAADLTVGLSLAKTGVDILSALFKKNDTTTAAALPATTVPTTPVLPGTMPGTTPGLTPITTTTSTSAGLQLPPGTAPATTLAGAGPLGSGPAGLNAGLDTRGFGMSGAGGAIPNATGGLGGNAGASVLAGPAPGLAGATGVGASTAPGMSGARGGTGSSVVGIGGAPMAGAGRDDEQREAQGWLLAEDEDVWAVAKVPDTDDGVLK